MKKIIIAILILTTAVCKAQIGIRPGLMFVNSAAPAVFIPTDTAGCKLWSETYFITGLVDGDPISSLFDSSGNFNHLVNTGSNRPIYETNEINGYPVARMTAASSQFFNLTAPISSARPLTYMFLYKKAGAGSIFPAISSSAWDANELPAYYDYSDGNAYFGNNGGSQVKTISAGFTSYTTVTVIASATLDSVFVNGTNVTVTDIAPSFVGIGSFDLIGRLVGTLYATGDLVGVIIYDHALTTAGRVSNENRWRTKYAHY